MWVIKPIDQFNKENSIKKRLLATFTEQVLIKEQPRT